MRALWILRYCKIDSSQSKGRYTNSFRASGEIPKYAEELNPIYPWNFIMDTVHNTFIKGVNKSPKNSRKLDNKLKTSKWVINPDLLHPHFVSVFVFGPLCWAHNVFRFQ